MSMFDPESRNALAAFLASEKNLQPYDAQQRQGRGWLLPVADNPYTGKPQLSQSTLTDFISHIPGSIYDAVTAPGRAYSGQIPQWQDDGQGNARTSDALGSEALNVAGVAAGGGTVFGRVPKPLPQSAAPMFERRMIPSGEADAAMARTLAGPDPVAPRPVLPTQDFWSSIRPDPSKRTSLTTAYEQYLGGLADNGSAMMFPEFKRELSSRNVPFVKHEGRDQIAGDLSAGQSFQPMLTRPNMPLPANDSFTTPFTGDRLLYSNPNKPTPGALAVGAQERQGMAAVRDSAISGLHPSDQQFIRNALSEYSSGSPSAKVAFDTMLKSKFRGRTFEQDYGAEPFKDRAAVYAALEKMDAQLPELLAGKPHKGEKYYRTIKGDDGRTTERWPVFGSSSPEVSASYALDKNGMPYGKDAPSMRRLSSDFNNALHVDAGGTRLERFPLDFGYGKMTVDDLARWATDTGYDGLVVKNAIDTASKEAGKEISTIVAGLSPKSLKNDVSGDFLYSNPAGAPGGLFSGQQDTDQKSVLNFLIQRYLGQ